MKVNNVGILRSVVTKHYPIGYVKIIKGETSKSTIEIFKEYIGSKLDLKVYLIRSKASGKVKKRLLHINPNNKKIVYKKEEGF